MSEPGVRNRTGRVVGRLHQRDLGEHESVDILCAGDLHVGDDECDLGLVHGAVSWAQEADNRFLVFAGDMLNMATRGSVSDVHGATMSPQEQLEQVARILAPVSDRVIAVIRGNHDFRAHKDAGLDPVSSLCAIAGLPYFEDEAYLCLKVGHWGHCTKATRMPVNYIGFIDHGHGGGRKSGGKLNSAMQARDIFAADFFVSGHGHDPIIKPDVRWHADAAMSSIVEDQQFFIVCGSSLRGRPGGGYRARFGYRPLASLWPVLTLDGTHKYMSARTSA